MEGVILRSTGAIIDSLMVPPLQLQIGESLCLHLPSGSEMSFVEEHLVAALTGKKRVTGVQALGQIRWVTTPLPPRGLQVLFYHPRAVDWLRREGRMTGQEAEAVIARLDLIVNGRIGKFRIGCVPYDGRLLLGLEAAWARKADAVVFDTVGLGEWTSMRIFEAVAARLGSCAAIHLSYELSCAGQIVRSCFPGARCIPVTLATKAKQAG
jgi:hypothetical protein